MMLRNEIEQFGIEGISVSSAGLYASPNNPPDPKMLDYLLKMGISAIKHRSRKMKREDADWADSIFVMEKEHARMIENLWPDAKEKTMLFGGLVSEGIMPDDIIDPFGRSPYHYRSAQTQITMAVKTLVKRLQGHQTK